ncbi:MAG: M48 family metallopeptidase [Christensenellaceae bacterium]|jgi:predicted metal-dependent hydrolase|nr:M48 family metallopeptidase [Christensenellaceae bacterium]
MLDPRNIIRSKRKNLSLLVNSKGELIVRAPIGYPDSRIFAFIKQKEIWIAKKQEQIRSNSYLNQNVANYNTYLFLGVELNPIISNEVKKITLRNNDMLIPAKYPQEKIFGKIEKHFRKVSNDIIVDRCLYYEQQLRLTPSKIVINNNKTRWGVCTNQGLIGINWRAVCLPPNLLDYIIVHEFCHLLEFNHTKAFWGVVNKILPDWKARRTHLKHLNWILSLFRK